MNESYAEAGVKRDKSVSSYFIKAGIVLAIILVLFIGGLSPIGGIATLVATFGVICCIYLFPRFNVEFEYIYCDGQLDFDKITGNTKRRTQLRIDFDKVDIIAPVKSHALDSYNHMDLKVRDFSSLKPDTKVYALVCHIDKGNLKILFEPSEKMLACIKQKYPRKISEC